MAAACKQKAGIWRNLVGVIQGFLPCIFLENVILASV
jgi:sulfite exporter TauE/SafE